MYCFSPRLDYFKGTADTQRSSGRKNNACNAKTITEFV